MRTFLVLSALVFVGACSSHSGPAVPAEAGTICSSPRPQVCTMEYNPVCAALADGSRKQYASGCNACADDAVKSYLPGECPVVE